MNADGLAPSEQESIAAGSGGGFGEIPYIESHDQVAVSDDRCGKYVTIARIRQIEPRDQRFMTRNQAVQCGPVHQVSRALKRCPVAVWLVPEQSVYPFTMNLGSSFRAK